MVEASWNVMAHAQKPDFVFRRNGRVHLNRRGRQFSRLLAAEVCASAIVILATPCSEVVWRVLATHSIRQFPLHFPSRASPCAITFKLDSIMSAYASVTSAVWKWMAGKDYTEPLHNLVRAWQLSGISLTLTRVQLTVWLWFESVLPGKQAKCNLQ